MRYALIYGAIGGAITIAIITATFAFDVPNHFQTMWFGYLVMLAAMSLIFVGVKRYRDVECGGVTSFGRAFKVGLGIAVVAALVYVAGWEAYLATKPPVVAEYIEMYPNPLTRMPITFLEIFPVGLLVALVSAVLLRNPRFLPARVG